MEVPPLLVVSRRIDELKTNPANARTHSKKQIREISASIVQFGFVNPVLIGPDDQIIAGHGRVQGARAAGLSEIPIITLAHLSTAQRRALLLADNKIALNAGWDQEKLAFELKALTDLSFDLPALGFSIAESDLIVNSVAVAAVQDRSEIEDDVPELLPSAVTRFGDIWELGRHRLLCGDARLRGDLKRLLGKEHAALIFTDPPYNVPIDGHVCGSGSIHHREFAMASGEMSEVEFEQFLVTTLGNAASFCSDGSIAFVCMDWRHVGELNSAGRKVFAELKNICVWNKKVAGMGTFYRSKHELIFVFKNGTAPHTNSFGLGDTGRYRTNVWDYAGITGGSAGRLSDLAMHPTVKPVALVADAIKDCSRRGDIVLDVFGGSGTTLIAAQSCGRIARIIEYDPVYCDTIIRRYEAVTGRWANLKGTGTSFEDLGPERLRLES